MSQYPHAAILSVEVEKGAFMPFEIFLVDDDEDDVRFVIEAFPGDADKYHFTWLKDGVELMNSLNNCSRPDLILLDLNMPGIDGREALSLIKSNPGLKNFPVVIYSTSCEPLQKNRCLKLGADGYYCKPSSCREIKKMVEEILENHLQTV